MGGKRLASSSSSPPPQHGGGIYAVAVGGGGGIGASSASGISNNSSGGAVSGSSSSKSRSVLGRVTLALALCFALVVYLTLRLHTQGLEQVAERGRYLAFLQGASSAMQQRQPDSAQQHQQEHLLPTSVAAPMPVRSGGVASAVNSVHGDRASVSALRGAAATRTGTSTGAGTGISPSSDKGDNGGILGRLQLALLGNHGTNEHREQQHQVQQTAGHVDVVTGMAAKIDPKYLAVFLLSLRRVSVSADVLLFVDAGTARDARVRNIVARADGMAAEGVRGRNAHRGRISLVEFDDAASFPEHMRSYHPSSKRWALMHRHFERPEVRALYRYIMLVDVRDTAFQRDPFAAIAALAIASSSSADTSNAAATHDAAGAALSSQPQQKAGEPFSAFLTFRDDERITLAECGWNAGWVRDCFGDQMLERVGGEGIVCSGVSVGTTDAVLAYLKAMYTIIGAADQKTGILPPARGDAPSMAASMVADGYSLPPSFFPHCERNGVDQGVHNVLVRTPGAIPHLQIWGQAEGPVANMQSQMYSFDQAAAVAAIAASKGNGVALTPSSSAPFPEVLSVGSASAPPAAVAVAHQYDRDTGVQAALFKQYVYWMDTSDPMAEWGMTTQCARFQAVQNTDLFMGVCDLDSSGGATSPAACCSRCLMGNEGGGGGGGGGSGRCGGFVFLGPTCFLKTADCPASARTNVGLAGATSAYLK